MDPIKTTSAKPATLTTEDTPNEPEHFTERTNTSKRLTADKIDIKEKFTMFATFTQEDGKRLNMGAIDWDWNATAVRNNPSAKDCKSRWSAAGNEPDPAPTRFTISTDAIKLPSQTFTDDLVDPGTCP